MAPPPRIPIKNNADRKTVHFFSETSISSEIEKKSITIYICYLYYIKVIHKLN